MGVKTIYTTGSGGQIVSRGLYAAVERSDMPLDGGFGEAEIIEVESPADAEPMRVRIDTVPQDTIAISVDTAAKAATVMRGLSNSNEDGLGFRVEYSAD